MKSDSDVTAFGACALDRARRELRVGGEPRHLSPRALALLDLLLSERPRALARDELRTRLWPDTYVSNTSLAQLVTELRKAIGDDARKKGFIRTVFGFGYAFAGEAAAARPAEAPPAAGFRCWLLHRDRELPLVSGPNVVGRAPDADVRLNFADVSRHHARIVVAEDGATLEDLGSRNGTFVAGRRISGPVALSDGDGLSIGTTAVVFVAASGTTTTHPAKRA